MRVLIVTPEFAPHAGGGIVRYYGNLVPALAGAGADVTVLVVAPFADEFDQYTTPEGVRVRCLPRDAVLAVDGMLPQFSAAPDFRRWLAASWAARGAFESLGEFDIVETTDFGLGFAAFVLHPPGPPLVVRCHGSLGQISEHEPRRPSLELDLALARLAESCLMPFADGLQTYALANSREWSSRLGREMAVLRPAMPVTSPEAASGDYALVVGRIQSWKGPETLCRAIRELPDRERPKVLWVGRDTTTAPDGESLDEYLQRQYPDVWGSRVQPIGPKLSDEVAALMAGARFVVVPSTWDVFNFTAIEGMAAGKTVVCSAGAGAHELVTNGSNGLLCDAASDRSLAGALRTAHGLTGDERGRLGQAARDTVRGVLDPASVATAHLDGYAGLRADGIAVPEWTAGFFTPSPSGRVGLDYLEQVSVRGLGSYVADRLLRRFTPGGGTGSKP